jgi:hypothetical protein
MNKAKHRPEFCPAIKTNCVYANHEWRTMSWDRSEPGRKARAEGWTYAPKLENTDNYHLSKHGRPMVWGNLIKVITEGTLEGEEEEEVNQVADSVMLPHKG